MAVISRFRPKIEYFDCAQFDRVAEIIGVKLAAQNRYSMKSRLGAKAFTHYKTRRIQFERDWLTSLSHPAKCGILVHEIWHLVSFKPNKIRATISYIYRILELLRLAVVFDLLGIMTVTIWVVVFVRVPSAFLVSVLSDLFSFFLIGLPFIIIEMLSLPYFFRRFNWSLEYESDEVAVRFIGIEPTKEFLRTIPLKSNRQSHPPTKKRLERVERIASKYPTPVIDWDSLEREVKFCVEYYK